MTMYLSYDKDMNDVLRKGNLAFSKDNNRWQSINHYNQTLDGTRAYNLTKDIGQTLNATLSGVAANNSDLSEAVRSMQLCGSSLHQGLHLCTSSLSQGLQLCTSSLHRDLQLCTSSSSQGLQLCASRRHRGLHL